MSELDENKSCENISQEFTKANEIENEMKVSEKQIDNKMKIFSPERLKDFFLKQNIDEKIIKYFGLKGLIFCEEDKIMQVSYDKSVSVYYDFETNCFESIEKKMPSLLLVGRKKTVIYVFQSLIEAMSYLSIVNMKRDDIKDYTLIVLYDNKVFDYYIKSIDAIEDVYIVGDFGRNLFLDKLQSSKKEFELKYISTVENSVNEDLSVIKKTKESALQ